MTEQEKKEAIKQLMQKKGISFTKAEKELEELNKSSK